MRTFAHTRKQPQKPGPSGSHRPKVEASPHFGRDFGRLEIRPLAAKIIQAKPARKRPDEETPVPFIVSEVLTSPGRPLDPSTRAYMEPRFGHDFSRVRVHTDTRASESARAVNALAYTVGRNVVFAAGRYSPGTAAGQELLAHELTHTVQQTSPFTGQSGKLTMASPGGVYEHEAEKVSQAVVQGKRIAGVPHGVSQPSVARDPDPVRQATQEERREVVDAAALWLAGMAEQIEAIRQMAAVALATTPGSAAGPRAFHDRMNQEMLGRLMENTISVFEAQRSDSPHVNFPAESPEQTRLGEAYARAIEQFGLALDEARANAANLAPTVSAAEEMRYSSNHLRWLEANPSAPLAAGVRTTFTRTERDLSTSRHRRVSTELANLAATVHQYNLAGNGAQRLRSALHDAMYRLVEDPTSGSVDAQRDTALDATLQPVLDQLDGIQWAVTQAIDRLDRAETRTRAFAADTAANQPVGNAMQTHFSTRDAGYATLLADRFARMKRELAGQGSLFIHAPNPNDSECGVGAVGGGISVTAAHADANHFFFCQNITIGDEDTVSTVVHETVHAVIPNLGATSAVASSSDTPGDRAYAYERIYSRMTTEESLDNAESYSYYVDELLGIQVSRPSAPQDVVTGCADAVPVHNAIARATYRIRLGAMWADQTLAGNPAPDLPQHIIDVVQRGFPGADTARAREVLTHMRYLAGSLDYYLPVVCRPASDSEARAGALVYGPSNAATAGSLTATSRTHPGGTLRICPAWFPADVAVREDSLTAILVLRYRSIVPAADVMGLVTLVRFIQEEAHPSVAGRTLLQHQAANAAPAPTP
jgi:hypothetical protein